MRILTVLGSAAFGGAERMAADVSAAWRAGGVHAEGVCLNDGPMRESFENLGVPLHGPLLKFSHDPWGMIRLERLVRQGEFNRLLVADIYRNALICSTWVKRRHKNNLQCWLWCSAVPGGQGGRFTPRLVRYLRKGWLNGLICVSEFQKSRLIDCGLSASCMTVVPNGVDLMKFASIPRLPKQTEQLPVFLQVANVMPDKDFKTLLEAVAILKKEGVGFELRLVGRGTNSSEMKKMIQDFGVTDRIVCLGPIEDIRPELANADIFVLSSHSEVCNVAVLEAMASSLAIITTDLPAFDSIFTQELEGLKVPSKNAVALSHAMQLVAENSVLRIRLALAAQKRSQTFSLTQTAKAILNTMA